MAYWWLLLVIPSLDRIAGSDLKIPAKKALRRYLVPLIFYLCGLGVTESVLLGLILSLNLDEIEDKNAEEVFLYGLALGSVFHANLGPYFVLGAPIWMGLVWLSNEWIRIQWRYAEIGRGLMLTAFFIV